MLLSIIIPHYNLPRIILSRCIESIVQQRVPSKDYEIIVVDDASNEPPLWLEKSFTGENVRLIIAAHGGPGAARNRGIEEAKGEYIEFIDADDMLLPDCGINECLDVLRDTKPDILRFEYKICTSPDDIRNERKEKTTFCDAISGAEYMRAFRLSGSPCNYFFRRELANEHGIRFPENMFHEDEVFNTKLHCYAGNLISSDATLYAYCIRKGSTTANSSAEFEERRIGDLIRAIEELDKFRGKEKERWTDTQLQGFKHKFTILSVDAIRNMMYTGMKANDIYRKCKEGLAPLGAYPLPKAKYSTKYGVFRILANSKAGMRILRILLPSKKPLKR